VPAGPTVSEGVNPLARMRAASRQGSPEPQKPVYDDFGNIVRSTADNGRDNGFGNGQPPSGGGGGFQNPLARGRQNPRGSTAGNGFGNGSDDAAAGQPRVTSTGDLFSLAPEKMPRRSISSGSLLRSGSTNSLNGSRRSSTASTTAAATAATATNDAASDAVVAAAAAKVAAAAVAPVRELEATTVTPVATSAKDVSAAQQPVTELTATTASTETDTAVRSNSTSTASGSSDKATAATAPSPTSTSAASSAGTTPTSAAGATATGAASGAGFGGKSWNRRRSDRDDNVTITYDQYGKSLCSSILSLHLM
jgi:hypothetical protein